MSNKSKYLSTNRSKHYLKCHLILVCKYRKKLLTGKLKLDMKNIIGKISQASEFEIEVMESDMDHIHLLLRYLPKLSISQIIRRLKQQSTQVIWKHNSLRLKNHFWYKKMFWSDGYFACSIGEAAPNIIRNYIL